MANLDKMHYDECGIFSEVDFGHGPVEIRCTETGRHFQHRCEVFIYPDIKNIFSPGE